MAGYFLRLKFALVHNTLRVGWRRRITLIMAVLVWTVIVAGGRALISASSSNDTLLALVFDSFLVGWLVFPLLGFGGDETLDPSRLALLPLSRTAMMGGLTVATLLGVAPIATLITVAGALNPFPNLLHLAIIVMAVLLEVLLCVIGSRAVTTAFSGILRSRKGKDVLVFVIAIAAVLPTLAGQVIPRLLRSRSSAQLASAARGLFWLPSGWAARAILLSRQGHEREPLLLLAAVAGVVLGLGLIWSVALERTLTSAESSGAKSAHKTADLFARPFGLLPRTQVGAIAAKELRYTWRDPRRRAALVTVLLLAGLPAIAFRTGGSSPKSVLYTAGAALVFGLQALNQFGTDGPAFWLNVASGRDPATDFRGKNLASLLLGMTGVTLGSVLVALIVGGWGYVPAAILLGGAVMGVTLGVANQVSVLVPFPMPDAATNLWAGPGCLTGLSGLLALWVVGALLIPVIVGILLAFAFWRPGLLVVCLASTAYGWGVWRLGLSLATNRMRSRELDLLAIVSGARGA